MNNYCNIKEKETTILLFNLQLNLKLINYFNTKKQNSTCGSTCNKGGPEVSFQWLHRRNSKQTKKLELCNIHVNLKIDFAGLSLRFQGAG